MEHSKLTFGQTKLTKDEWDYIEKPIQGNEKNIIEFIKNNYNNTEHVSYPYTSLSEYLKMNMDKNIQNYILEIFLKDYIIQLFTLVDIFNIVKNNKKNINDNSYEILKNSLNKITENKYIINLSFKKPQCELKNKKNIKLKSKDNIRLSNTFNKNNLNEFINNDKIYDFVFIKQIVNILHSVFSDVKSTDINNLIMEPSKTRIKIQKCFSVKNNENWKIEELKTKLRDYNTFVDKIIDKIYGLINIINDIEKKDNIFITTKIVKEIVFFIASSITNKYAISKSQGWLENNMIINKYKTTQFYEHQKQICNIFREKNNIKNKKNNFVYYCAPTGTGKTLTPLAFANNHKVIFMCAARHIGLTFARNAISCGYKIALAFNCKDTEDIRLHYSAAKVFTKNYKSGGVFKVDNTIGDKVDIIICDIKSYLYASLYMKAFNKVENIITFWDEPTISLDYENHELHDIIYKNWSENIIPNMILSSATLPNSEHIETIAEMFSKKFNCNINYIKTSEYNKSICIYNLDSNISTPHLYLKKINASYEYLQNTLNTIKNDNTLMRYLHIDSCIDFINFMNSNFNNKFNELSTREWYNITSNYIKKYYIDILSSLTKTQWECLDINKNKLIRKYYDSNIYFLTKDAYTLTNGPSIFLTNDVFRIAKFCFQQLNIQHKELEKLHIDINYNNTILNKVKILEKKLEDEEKKQGLNGNNEKKILRTENQEKTTKIKQLQEKIDNLYSSIRKIHLNNEYIPNTYEHLTKYNNNFEKIYKNINVNGECFTPFSSTLEDKDITRIVSMPDIEDSWRLLLMCGIGIVSDTMSNQYNVLINELASEKKLFMLIASSDYIYGTNYSFHHGYIGKDMKNCSRQKLIQALGRIGRGQTNQHYSIRMRDDEIIKILFDENENNTIEAENMNKLFTFKNNEANGTYENTSEVCIDTERLYNEILQDGWIIEQETDLCLSAEETTLDETLIAHEEDIEEKHNHIPEYDDWEDAFC
jgi:hypothetical protein